jgi:hypothetical protein
MASAQAEGATGDARMLTVACVLKSGGIYDGSWVARLKAGVEQHMKMPHRFVCLSDVDVPCERIALEKDWPGWWSKVEAFKLEGPVLYFDLDTAIVGDLTDIASRAFPLCGFTILTDFYRPGGFGSGVMAWSNGVASGDLRKWYEIFAADPAKWMSLCPGGDQDFIERMTHRVTSCWQSANRGYLAGQIVSYKVHCRNGIPADARVVCLHGQPKFEAMPVNDPVRLAWERAA